MLWYVEDKEMLCMLDGIWEEGLVGCAKLGSRVSETKRHLRIRLVTTILHQQYTSTTLEETAPDAPPIHAHSASSKTTN